LHRTKVQDKSSFHYGVDKKNKKYKKLISEIEKQFSEEELKSSRFKKIKKRGEG